MKKWTTVIEFSTEDHCTREEVDSFICESLSGNIGPNSSYRIMEIIEAPYGPQHPDGVFIKGNLRAKFDESKQVRR